MSLDRLCRLCCDRPSSTGIRDAKSRVSFSTPIVPRQICSRHLFRSPRSLQKLQKLASTGSWSTSCFSRRPHGGPLPRPAAPKIRDQHARYLSTRPADRLADFPFFLCLRPSIPAAVRIGLLSSDVRLGPIAEKKVAFFGREI